MLLSFIHLYLDVWTFCYKLALQYFAFKIAWILSGSWIYKNSCSTSSMKLLLQAAGSSLGVVALSTPWGVLWTGSQFLICLIDLCQWSYHICLTICLFHPQSFPAYFSVFMNCRESKLDLASFGGLEASSLSIPSHRASSASVLVLWLCCG